MRIRLNDLSSVKSRLVLPFWYRLTQTVPDKGPLNVRSSVVILVYYFFMGHVAWNKPHLIWLPHTNRAVVFAWWRQCAPHLTHCSFNHISILSFPISGFKFWKVVRIYGNFWPAFCNVRHNIRNIKWKAEHSHFLFPDFAGVTFACSSDDLPASSAFCKDHNAMQFNTLCAKNQILKNTLSHYTTPYSSL